jgi:2-polyprenyl-6-methoxyphenol hydroxylase-like FAD-dependent oxidoreductase
MQPKPIAVVGAGPTGAMLGLLLAQRGIPVVLIEASRNFRRVFRGEGLMPSGLEALAQMGLLELLTQESNPASNPASNPLPNQPIGSWEFVIEDRSIFSVDEPMGNDRPCTLVAQPQLLESVIDRAKAYPNFRFISGETVQSLTFEPLINSEPTELGDVVGESIVGGTDHLGMNSKAHSQNPLKWVQDVFISVLQSFMGLSYEPRNSFRGGSATKQGAGDRSARVSGCVLSSGETLETSLVIGCDGRTSAVRRLADLPLAESSKPFNILWFKLPDTDRIPSSNPFTVFVKGDAVFSVFRSSEGVIQVGWTVQNDDWKAVTDWSETLAAASPPWLAEYFRSKEIVETIADRPVLLTVTVGNAPQWSRPGCLLLGDAAHPMSPIRAQGINMALRDAIVATNHLVKAWNSGTPPTPNSGGFDSERLDQALVQIQADRDPEIRRIQTLQAQEAADGAKLHHSAALRQLIKALAPAIGIALKQKWLLRQRELRSGVTEVKLEV